MGNSGKGRSNAKISDDDIMKSLSKRGTVKVFEQEHKEFNTGKEKRNDNKERIFFVKVEKST